MCISLVLKLIDLIHLHNLCALNGVTWSLVEWTSQCIVLLVEVASNNCLFHCDDSLSLPPPPPQETVEVFRESFSGTKRMLASLLTVDSWPDSVTYFSTWDSFSLSSDVSFGCASEVDATVCSGRDRNAMNRLLRLFQTPECLTMLWWSVRETTYDCCTVELLKKLCCTCCSPGCVTYQVSEWILQV